MTHPISPKFDAARRRFLVCSAATVAAGCAFTSASAVDAVGSEKFTLPSLPYAYEALEPVIDATTMKIHHTKHHQAYIDKLNAAIETEPSLKGKSLTALLKDLQAIPESVRSAVRNHGGGHANHSFFWTLMRSPQSGSGGPEGDLASAITSKFGSVEKMKELFGAAATTQFGSGWAWLVTGPSGLEILSTANQDSPLSVGKTPLLGLDVWEHAYYLKYQNRRPDYVAAWWSVVNWNQVERQWKTAS